MKLNELEIGMTACVTKLKNESTIYQRLIDIGLVPGTNVECILISPMKNPKAYMIRGAVIAIRNEDASTIEVE